MSADLSILTSQSIPAIWEEREQIFKASEFDLSEVKSIDSAGIAFLVQWAKSLPNSKLRLLNTSKNIRSLIETFHLEAIFEIVD